MYEEYGKRRGTDSLTYLKDDRSMEMVNLKTGETRYHPFGIGHRIGGNKMRYLTFALTKGRLASKTLELLERLGTTCDEMKDKDSRKFLTLCQRGTEAEIFSGVKDRHVPTYVEYGAADIGVVGRDTIVEEGRKVH